MICTECGHRMERDGHGNWVCPKCGNTYPDGYVSPEKKDDKNE